MSIQVYMQCMKHEWSGKLRSNSGISCSYWAPWVSTSTRIPWVTNTPQNRMWACNVPEHQSPLDPSATVYSWCPSVHKQGWTTLLKMTISKDLRRNLICKCRIRHMTRYACIIWHIIMQHNSAKHKHVYSAGYLSQYVRASNQWSSTTRSTIKAYRSSEYHITITYLKALTLSITTPIITRDPKFRPSSAHNLSTAPLQA